MRESTDRNFSFDESTMLLSRVEGIDSFRTMVKLLEERNKKLQALSEPASEERIQLDTELTILALLACCKPKPIVDLAKMKRNILAKSMEHDKSGRESDGLDIVTFHSAVYNVLESLGLE